MSRWMVLLALALPATALGQEGLKPEVLLMIDGSAQMGEPLGGGQVECEPRGASGARAGVVYTPDTPLNIVKEALIGTIREPDGRRWCTADEPNDRDGHALGRDGANKHIRQMCCADGGANCNQWLPCYNDHGGALASSDAVGHAAETARSGDGVIDVNIETVKYGLMFTDGNEDDDRDADGHYSYGDDNKRLPDGTPINLGARRPGNHIGGLIRPGRVKRINGGNVDQNEVGEENADVRSHNEAVREIAGRLVPHGLAPLSGLMHDVVDYYEDEPLAPCRHRSAILITRGRESEIVANRPLGFPYQQAHTYVDGLNERGIPLHVVLIAPDGDVGAIAWGQRVANASEGGSFTRVTSAEQLRKRLVTLSRAGISGRRSQTRPLIVSASAADYCPNGAFPCAAPDDAAVQWRINAFAWVAGGAAYGRIHASELTCAERDADRPSVPQPREDLLKYEEVLRSRAQRERRTVSYRSDERRPFVVTGGADPVFSRDGNKQFNDDAVLAEFLGVQEAEVRDPEANRPADDGNRDDLAAEEEEVNDDNGPVVENVPDDPNRIRAAGLLVNGHFGARGLGDDARPQLGATITGDVIALRPPALGINEPSYLAYRTLEDRRKTIVAAGGRDGLIHFFRAVDGVEILNLLPGAGWGNLITGEAPMDGPLAVADLVPCRSVEGGNNECPEQLNFEAWLVGTSGRSSANIFGLRLSSARALLADPDRALDLDSDVGEGGVWDKGADDLQSEVLPELTLAGASSRPTLTHVRDGARIRAAIIVGCGEGESDPVPSSAGRCILILDATNGEVIRRFDVGADANIGGEMLYSMTGSPVVYPAGGIAPASRAYIGDAGGQIWRLDLRDTDPDNWQIAVAWPPQDAEQRGEYRKGRAVVDRPSLALREDGGLVVTFATDRTGEIEDDQLRAYAVSFTDRAVIGDDAVTYQVTRNWLLPFNDGEYATGAPIIRDGIVFFTTREGELDEVACGDIRGRLYGVDYYKRFVDEDGDPASFTGADGQSVEALPALSQFDQDGPTGQRALSIILPPGMVAYGMAIALTPSCADEVGGTTDLILNVADETVGARAQGDAAVNQAKVEVVQNGSVDERPLNGGVFMQSTGVSLQVCLDCTADGQPAQGATANPEPPFPSQVVYWGSTFLN